jgi:hypothetical protein
MLELRTVGGAALAPALVAIATRMATLEDVIRRRELRLCEVVVQDEYTHDVICEVIGGQIEVIGGQIEVIGGQIETLGAHRVVAQARFLVFDAT